ncbi:hypothetical protein GALL_431680 [mine drainage metagenome]|uniref:Uncharacterized protein n=1 Tax=mine drainage metagenome TaxID=410659 RepID=A0A1J5PWB7_9ZZZZ
MVGEQARGQVDGLLRPRGNEHLLGRDPHRTRQAEILRHRHAQRHIAALLSVVEQIAVEAAPVFGLQLLPELDGELGELDRPRGEGLYLIVRRPRLRGEQRPTLRQFTRGLRRRPRSGFASARGRAQGAEVGQGVRHEGAAALLRGQVALGGELVDGRHDGVARQVQIARQITRRRQLHPGGHAPGKDGRTQRQIEPAVQRRHGCRLAVHALQFGEQKFGQVEGAHDDEKSENGLAPWENLGVALPRVPVGR